MFFGRRGVLYLHCDFGDEPLVLTGTRREGIKFPGIPNPFHAVFILFSPEDAPSEGHLKALGKLANLPMGMPAAVQITKVKNFEEFIDLLNEPTFSLILPDITRTRDCFSVKKTWGIKTETEEYSVLLSLKLK